MKAGKAWVLACCTSLGAGAAEPVAPRADDATVAALGNLGLAMLRQSRAPNAVASPVALAAALGMVHAGTQGRAEREIEQLFGPRQQGPLGLRKRLPALLRQLGGDGPEATPAQPATANLVWAGHVWLDLAAAPAVPAAYTQRLALRYRAGATRVNFQDTETVRRQINTWTAEHTAGRINDLMPPGSLSAATQLTLSTALHFRSPWLRPFDAERTEARDFHLADGGTKAVPTLNDERTVLQAMVDGVQVLALPFAGETHTLLLAQPPAGRSVAEWLQGLDGATLARWQQPLQAQRCALSLPKFALAPAAAGQRTLLESLGLKTAFTPAADLRPMLGRQARAAHLGEIFHAAGIQIDERGGEAVAAAAATVQSKSLALPAPPCAVDRPFVFAVLHRASGAPLFVGRIGDPTLSD